MANVFAIAKHFLSNSRPMPSVKLHCLLYYAQAEAISRYQAPLFEASIEARERGPVITELYSFHKKHTMIGSQQLAFQSDAMLSALQRETIQSVLRQYGDKSTRWLIDQVRAESPWRQARSQFVKGENTSAEIPSEFFDPRARMPLATVH